MARPLRKTGACTNLDGASGGETRAHMDMLPPVQNHYSHTQKYVLRFKLSPLITDFNRDLTTNISLSRWPKSKL